MLFGVPQDLKKNEVIRSDQALKKVHENIKEEYRSSLRPIYAKDFVEICEIIGQDSIMPIELLAPFLKKNPDGSNVLIMDKSLKDRKDVERSLILPTENMDYFKRLIPYLKEYRKEARKKNIAVSIMCGMMMQQIYEFVFGLTDFSLLLYDDLMLIENLLDAGMEYWINFSKYIIKEGLVDFIFLADDVAFNSGLFIRYDNFKKLYLDRYKKIMEPFAANDIPIVFHSDGNLYEIMNDLIEMGVNCLDPIDPYAMDYKEVKKKYGKNISIMGNINLTFPLTQGTPEDVRKDIKDHMDICKPGYGYICATSHSVVNYIPDENFVAFIDAIHELGVY